MFDIDYIRPQTVADTLDFLNENALDTAILAGGTDIMVDMRSGKLNRRYLLDVGQLEELRGIEFDDGNLTIGAGVTITEIGQSDLIGHHAPALHKVADKFASRQVRNIATIGGNVANCSPCGDTIPPLLIHDAGAVVVGPSGKRTVPVEEMASAPYHCELRPDELITHFILKTKPAEVEFADFQKIGRRKALAVARISMAAMIAQGSDHRISYIRFALGSCTPTPHRFRDIENFLFGKVPEKELLWKAGKVLSQKMMKITGRRVSTAYKEPAIQGLFMRMMYPLVI